MKKPQREFLGTYPCFLCGKRVRVYDWLPECVLCAACERRIAKDERRSMGPDEYPEEEDKS